MMNAEQARRPTIVLIHGMWMTPRCWEGWVDRYRAAGYEVLAPAWPGLEVEVESLRRDPTPLKGLGVRAILAHYDRIIRGLSAPPIIMGHSFGGAITELLLDRGLGAAGVAVHPVPVKGVYWLPPSTLRCLGPIIVNPFKYWGVAPLSERTFHYAFTNNLTRAESDRVYHRYHVPGVGRAIFQGAFANFAPKSPFKLNFANPNRAPLMLMGSENDHIMPASIQRETAKRYEHGRVPVDLRIFKDRSHYTLGEPGWEEIADEALGWALDHATQRAPAYRPMPVRPAVPTLQPT